jgi:type I restriction enzyme S subunit
MSPVGKKRPLPPGWRWARLGEEAVCKLNPKRPSGFSRELDAPTTFVPMSAVDDQLGAITTPEVRTYKEVSRGYTYFQEGDVLFAKITPCMQNGKSAIASGLIDGVGFGSTEFHILRPSPLICAEWLYLFVRQPSFRNGAARYFTGSVGQQRVPAEFLARTVIPLPPLDEQRGIAARLSEQIEPLERMRQEAQAQLEAIEALPGALLEEVFGGFQPPV